MTALSHRTSGITQLEFHQAMTDFKTMFPEMDEDVIEVVLRANNGAVDATIDQLLAMNLDCENERLRTELDASDNNEVPPRYSPATPPPSYQQAVPIVSSPMRPTHMRTSESNQRSNASNLIRNASVTAASPIEINTNSPSKDSLRYMRKWNPPLVGQLPRSFLRVEPNENQRKIASSLVRQQRNPKVGVINSAMLQQRMEENQRQRQMSLTSDDPGLSRYLEDERVAIFLQNEEFLKELRHNKDFMSTLELDSGDLRSGTSGSSPLPDGPMHGADSDAVLKEKLKHLSKMSVLSRKKFAQLARIFSGRKRRSFQQLLSDGGNPSRDNLLSRDDEYTQLQNEGSDNDDFRRDDAIDARDLIEDRSNSNAANGTSNANRIHYRN